jgi:hypothetical protein
MSESSRKLDTVQRWMQSVITHPAGIAAGIDSSAAQEQINVGSGQIEEVISRSKALTSIERLEVYGNAYYARLLECLRTVYPALSNTLGEELFNEFAFEYLQAYPSRSYTLEHLGTHFAKYLDETRPAEEPGDDNPGDGDLGDGEPNWPDFLVDLARLEWTVGEVFDGPGAEGGSLLEAEQLQGIAAEAWPHAKLKTVPCLRLLMTRFPLSDFYMAARNAGDSDEGPAPPAPKDSYQAITRINYVVRRFDLSRVQYELLAALIAGETVGEALMCAAELAEGDDEQLAQNLQSWFAEWTSAQFFQAIELPD